MGIVIPSPADFRLVVNSNGTARPTATYGTALTAALNAYPTGTGTLQVLSALANNSYMFDMWINSNSVSTVARDSLVAIYRDPAGGTAWEATPFMTDILGSSAGPVSGNATLGPILYRWPIFVKAGTSLGASVSMNTISATTTGCRVTLVSYQLPDRPVRSGSYFTAIGSVPTLSAGTLVVPGQASEGALTILGTTSKRHFWWQLGIGMNSGVMSTLNYDADLLSGVGLTTATGNFKNIVVDQRVGTGGSETLWTFPVMNGGYADIASADTIQGRAQCSGIPDVGFSMAAYAIGGVGG